MAAHRPLVHDAGRLKELPSGDTVNMEDEVLQRPELKDYSETVFPFTVTGSTVNCNLENGNVFNYTLQSTTQITILNPSPTGKGCSFTLILTQDGFGGRAVTFSNTIYWAGGSMPTLTTTAGAISILTFLTVDAGTTWFGFLAGDDMS